MIPDVLHSLGAGGWCAAAGGAMAVVTAAMSRARKVRTARRRREALLGAGAGRRGPGGVARRRREHPYAWTRRVRVLAAPWAVPVAVGAVAAWAVGGVPGCLVGAVAVYGARRWRGRAAGTRASPAAVAAESQLPEAAELLAACLASGAAPVAAADAVGRTLGGPLGEELRRIAAEVRLGGDPVRCWQRLSGVPGTRDLARWMARAASTGVPPVAAVTRLAAECRAGRGRSAAARARRAAVLATAPLGLCFLPAFLAVGVVPVVIGLAEVMTAAG